METIEVLEKLGLSEKQASVYLAALELGTASVEAIAKKAGTKRPTTYLILDELKTKGLVSTVPRAKKILHTAETPELLLRDINRKEELLKRFLPNLFAIYNAKKEKPQVQLYEGKEGMRHVYEKLINSGEVRFFATIRDVANIFPDVPERVKRAASERKLKVQEILTQKPEDISYAKGVKQSAFYENRFFPKNTDIIATDNAIFGDNVVFFSYDPILFAVLIESRGISQSLKTLFEMAWENALPYEKVINLARGAEVVE